MHHRVVAMLWAALLLGHSGAMSGPAPSPPPKLPPPQRITTPGNHTIVLKADDHPKLGERDRRYIVHVPVTYDGKRLMPVVIMLHGGGGTARNAMVETGWSTKAERAGFLAVFPEGTAPDASKPARFFGNPQTWNDGSGRFYSGENKIDDGAFMSLLMDDLMARLTVDDRRIYVTGFSNGASMAFRLGVELGDRIAAIAPVSGLLQLKNPKPDRPLSLLYIIGAEDPLVPLEGGRVRMPWGGVETRPPARDSVLKWVEMLQCPQKPKPLPTNDGVKAWKYGPGRNASEVVFYVIDGMGHTWPGGKRLLPERIVGKTSDKIKANDVIWEFFRQHPKK